MSIEDKIVLLSAKINPTEEELRSLNALLLEVQDWKALCNRLLYCSVAPLFYFQKTQLPNVKLIPQEEYRQIKQRYFYTLTRGVFMYKVLQKTLKLLHDQNIEVVVLKGAYLAEAIYEDIALRLFSDIDLLVKEEDAGRAYEVLSKNGYSADSRDDMFQFLAENVGFEHLPQLVYSGVAIELHLRLHKQEEKYQLLPEKIWKHAKEQNLAGVDTLVPDLSDLLIHTILHLYKHFRDGEVQFTGFNDIVNILDIYKDKLDWIEIIRRTIQYGCEDIVFKFIVLVNRNYRAYVPLFIISEYLEYATPEDQALFEKYMSGFHGSHFSVVSSLNRIKNISEPLKRMKYVFWMVFPSKKYMIKSYRIKHPNLYLFYYPYRFWLGIQGLMRAMCQRKRKKVN